MEGLAPILRDHLHAVVGKDIFEGIVSVMMGVDYSKGGFDVNTITDYKDQELFPSGRDV